MERLWQIIPRLLLVATAAGALRLVADVAALYAAMPSGAVVAAPYAVAGMLLLAAAWVLGIDPPRGRLLAIGGEILLASWVVAIGYGPTEFVARATALLGLAAALTTLLGTTRGWAALAGAVLAGAAVPLLYVLLAHPPLGLIACYAAAAMGVSAASLSFLPGAARHWPPAALASLALVVWLLGVIVLFFAYGAPLSAS